jgi:hypothetical protein
VRFTECSSIRSFVFEPVDLVRPVRTSGPKKSRLHWFSVLCAKTAPKRRNRYRSLAAEVLEQRQLLTGDPMGELNTKFALAIGISNGDIDAFFNGGSTGAVGGVNGALGGAAAGFNQLPLGGSEIEDPAIIEVSSQFGTVETRVGSSFDQIKGAKPVIAFPETFSIGTQYNFPMMMMPGMQMGSRGYTFVNAFTGDFYGTSNWVFEVPASPGVMASRLSMQGTISQTNGTKQFELTADYTKQLPAGNQAFRVYYANPGSGEILNFSASQTSGPITTFASREMNGYYTSFGGSADFGDIKASFSKTRMLQTDKLFGSIEYVSGNTRASAEFMQHTSPTANVTVAKAMMSYMNMQTGLEKYLQVGVGRVAGTVSGQTINESFGVARMKLPIKRPFIWSPKYIDVSSTWHNGSIPEPRPCFRQTHQAWVSIRCSSRMRITKIKSGGKRTSS